jgi:hypothetical protein
MLMSAPRRLIWAALLFCAVSFCAVPATAFCGLQSCPRPAGSGETPRLEAALRTRLVAYDIAGNAGHYAVTAPRVFVNYAGFAVGAEVPFTRLDNQGSVVTGFSNPVVMARYARRVSHAWSAEAGIQWELPVGNQEDGLAGDHHMLLPWIGARRDFGSSWYATGMFGVSTAVPETRSAPMNDALAKAAVSAKIAHEGHDHGAALVLVNPHADREIQARVALGLIRGRATLEGFGLTQTDVSSTGPETYARVGALYEWSLVSFTSLQVLGDLPVTAARRNEAEIGVTIKTGW